MSTYDAVRVTTTTVTTTTSVTMANSSSSIDNHKSDHRNRSELPRAVLRTINDNVRARKLEPLTEDDEEKIQEINAKYHPSNLNEQQRAIFDYIDANPEHIVVIQAGPGTGKTFTLMSIATTRNYPATVIIYKHDLLHTFRYHAYLFTVAKFFMKILGLTYYKYKAFERQLSMPMSGTEFITCILGILRNANLDGLSNAFIIMDEYTVIPKPLFLITLMLLKQYRIGTIISGDRNQLQNIHNSKHARCSSYDIATAFADRTFSLGINERCSDANYNSIIDHVSRYSSSKRMDDYMYALVATVFPQQLAGSTSFSDIHLASTHRELTHMVHMLVVNNNIKTSFYFVSPSQKASWSAELEEEAAVDDDEDDLDDGCNAIVLDNGMIQPRIVTQYVRDRQPGKFLPYLPLLEGCIYYYLEHSEHSRVVLLEIDERNERLKVQSIGDGEIFEIGKTSNNRVVFEPHRLNILNGVKGTIYNYPIYPVNIMSMHKCQGCTITDKLDINLYSSNNQSLYVALSRVKDSKQITRIIIPNMISHLVSTIVNVPEHTRMEIISAKTLALRMTNYVMYHVQNPILYAQLIMEYISCSDYTLKTQLRNRLIQMAVNEPQEILHEPSIELESNELAIHKVMNDYNLYLLLSTVENSVDRTIWLHEFIRNNPELAMLRGSRTMTNTVNVLSKFVNLSSLYPYSVSTVEYIERIADSTFKFELAANSQNAFVLYEVNENIVATVPTKFRYDVYTKLKNNVAATNNNSNNKTNNDDVDGKLSLDWLYKALIEMPKMFAKETENVDVDRDETSFDDNASAKTTKITICKLSRKRKIKTLDEILSEYDKNNNDDADHKRVNSKIPCNRTFNVTASLSSSASSSSSTITKHK